MLRFNCILAFVLLICLVSGSCFSFEPVLKAGVKVQADGSDLDVGTYAIPRVCDWNNDGKRDLVIGEHAVYGSGKVRLYLNSGTDDAPVFTTYSFIQADGVDISVTGSGCQGAGPEVVDWNGDDKKDLLVGDAVGYVHLFLNEGTDAAPVLGAGSYVQVGGLDYKADARAVPCINDWDEDTEKDLLVGRGDGEISLLINTNTDADPIFSVDDRVYADYQILDAGYRVAPRIFDWNGDGYKDLIAGEGSGWILFYENIRTPSDPGTDPILADGVYLFAGGWQIDIGSRSRPEIVDWHNDGLPDILVGSNDGWVYYFEQEFIFEFESISYDSLTGTSLVWRSRTGDTYTVYYSTNMVDWYVLDGSVPSDGYTTEWTDSGSIGETKRLYRIGLAE